MAARRLLTAIAVLAVATVGTVAVAGCGSNYSPQAQKACNQVQKTYNSSDKSDTNPAIC